MKVELIGDWPEEIADRVGGMLASLDSYEQLELPEGTIGMQLVDDPSIRDLNRRYNEYDQPTDVLTFAYAEEGADDGELADIVISADTAERQAAEAGNSFADEVALLALHGILHAIGMDHQDETETERIERLQSEILAGAGIPYRPFRWSH